MIRRFGRFFCFGDGQDFVNGFFFGRINKSAGIDDDDIRVGMFVNQGMAGLAEKSSHDFRINQIFRTAQTDNIDFCFLCVFQPGSFLIRTFLGLAPSEGPTMPSDSIFSIMRAARLYPIFM